MSSYSLAVGSETHYHHHHSNNTVFDKVQSYSPGLGGNKANFTVSHLLDLEELPRENCAMYTNTDPATNPHGHTNGHTPHLNNSMCANNINNTNINSSTNNSNNSSQSCVHSPNNTTNNNTVNKNNNSITEEDKRTGVFIVRFIYLYCINLV